MALGTHPPDDTSRGRRKQRYAADVERDMQAIFGMASAQAGPRHAFSAESKMTPGAGPPPGSWMSAGRLWMNILLVLAILAIGGIVFAWRESAHPAQYTVQLAAPAAPQTSLPPTSPRPLLTPSLPAPARVDALPTPAAVQIAQAPTPVAPPPAAAQPAVATRPAVAGDAKPPVDATRADGRCAGTGYEHMTTCPAAAVLKADSALSAVYADAIRRDVDPSRLAAYSQRWSQLRQTAAADPDATADEFTNMTSQLNALIVAQAREKK